MLDEGQMRSGCLALIERVADPSFQRALSIEQRRFERHLALIALLLVCCGVPAPGAASSLCNDAIEKAEKAAKLPSKLLGAIAMVESGRLDLVAHRFVPWPWTINVQGTGFFFKTRDDAINAVLAARAAGRQSIDVGCMQINLLHHPNAFSSLQEAFDPEANTTYAASFLTRLFRQTGNWSSAAAAYHSQTPGVADDYQRRVVIQWSNAAAYGVTADRDAQSKPQERVSSIRLGQGSGYTAAFRAELAQNAADHRKLLQTMGIQMIPLFGAISHIAQR